MLSLWYDFADGEFRCATSENADATRFLRVNRAVCFEASTNRPPYIGVRGNGTATVDSDEDKTPLRRLLDRYLGGTDSELADILLDEDCKEVVVHTETERLLTWDFTDRIPNARETPVGQHTEPVPPRY